MKSQWLKPVEIEKLSVRKLRALIKHSYENVPYYHKIFKERNLSPEDIKSVKDLQKLPPLTKRIIRENFDKLIASNFPVKDLVPWSTTGTTEPFKFMQDRDSLMWINAAVLHSFYWVGYRRFDKLVNVWGFPKDLHSWKPWQRQLTISTFGADDQRIKYYVKLIKNFKPKGIRGYASSLYILAKQASGIKLDFAISTSEVLYDHYRKLIERKFGCEVYDNYSSREFMIASECKQHIGYHIAAENVIVEFVRDDEHVAPGERGEILITDLTKYGMPFIRYKIGDVGRFSNEVCPCGRGLPLMRSIEGRIQDIVFTPSGKFIGLGVGFIFQDLSIEQFQLVQKTKGELVVRIVKDQRYPEVDTQFILDQLRKYLGADMKLEVEFVDKIPATRSGKRLVAVSKVNAFKEKLR